MSLVFASAVFAAALLLAMLLMIEIGRRVGARHRALDPQGAREGVTALEGAVFALLGLMVAFTFSGAATRFDSRRQLLVQEANAIGTAYLRIDLLPAAAQPALRDGFRRYVDSRLATYRALPDIAAADAGLARSAQIQNEMWTNAVAATREGASPHAAMLFLPALNEVIDSLTTELMASRTHPPVIIFVMLAVLALVSSLLAGYDMPGGKRRSWIHVFAFAGIMAASVYVILDLEYPRIGFIRIDDFDRVLTDLRQSMK